MDKILVGADHGGFELKEQLKQFLAEKGFEIEDYSPKLDNSDDYPDPAKAVAQDVAAGKGKGLLVCGTGIGMSIAANKVKGARAARVSTEYDAEMAAKHNNANLLTMGGRTTDIELAKKMLLKWLETPFEGDRHERRVNKISDMENC